MGGGLLAGFGFCTQTAMVRTRAVFDVILDAGDCQHSVYVHFMLSDIVGRLDSVLKFDLYADQQFNACGVTEV